MRTFGRLFYVKRSAARPPQGSGNLIKPAPARWVMTECEPHVAIRLKNNFKGIPISQAGLFSFPDTPEIAVDLEWFIQRYPMRMTEQDVTYLTQNKKAHLAAIEELEKITAPDYKGQVFKINGKARAYQNQWAEVFMKSKRILNGDDVGLGKTLEAILTMTQRQTLPAIVVVQAHLPKQWRDEIARFLPFAKIHIIKGTRPYNLPKADIYITTYSRLAGWVDFFLTKFFKSAHFDEVQELRRFESNKYAAAETLSASVEYCAGYSATPIYNYGIEMFNIMDAIKKGSLGTRDEFLREWCSGQHQVVTDPKALGAFLQESFLMLRRTRKQVKRELPEPNKIIHMVAMDDKAIENVEDLAKRLAMKTLQGSFTERGQASRELDMLLRQATGVGKAKFVAEYVKILLENGEPVLLAGWHREVYSIWNQELEAYKPVMYTGSESPAEKDRSKRAFMNGETNLMFISLRSGVGLDGLQKRCSYVVFGELDWSPEVHTQVIGRLRRDGQEDQVTAIYLLADEGSDPVIMDVLGLKASQANDIANPHSPITKQFSDESRVKKLAENFLKSRK